MPRRTEKAGFGPNDVVQADGPTSVRLVNRQVELQTLLAGLHGAEAGRGGAVLLAGEAGIGKSRLALELVRRARACELSVLIGRCREDEGAPAYWPWIEIVRSWLGQGWLERPELRHAAAHVAAIVPELRDVIPDLPCPEPSESAMARFRLFDGIASLLRVGGQQRGTLLVLEDIHRADTPTLLLLRFLGPTLSDAAILTLLTYRYTEVEPGTAVYDAIADLTAQPHVKELRLQRFPLDHVDELITASTGQTLARGVVSRIFQTTEGNPLFVCEVARLFAGGHREASGAPENVTVLPAAVEGVIAKRLSRLPEGCRRVLAVAAVIGREFTLPILEEVAQESRERLLALLAVAGGAHVVLPTPDGFDRYRFTHALIRDVLHRRLSTTERAELHERVGLALYQGQIATIRSAQGRFGELLEIASAVTDERQLPGGQVVVALCHAELGQDAEARRIVERLAASQFTGIPRDVTWLVLMCMLGEVCSMLGEVSIANRLYAMLSPFAGRFSFFGPSTAGMGAVSVQLGLLAATLGRWQEAEDHLTAALQAHERVGARVWIVRTELAYARMLLSRAGDGDAARARTHATRALASARALGMAMVGRGARAVLRALPGQGRIARRRSAASLPGDPVGETAPGAHIYRREGDYWTIAFDGSVCRLKSSAGLEHLSQLLRNPGREFLALELAYLRAGEPFRSGAHAMPVFDAKAKAAYRHRIDALRSEIDAEARGDDSGAENARQELEQLAHMVASALGLGGRTRRLGSANERARVNVTRTLKQVVRTIAQHLPALGKHLGATLRTGTFCVYRPDPRIPVDWRT